MDNHVEPSGLAGTRTVSTDFGIARPLVGSTTLTPHGSLIGTPLWKIAGAGT